MRSQAHESVFTPSKITLPKKWMCLQDIIIIIKPKFWLFSTFPHYIFCIRLDAKAMKSVDMFLLSSMALWWGYKLI